MHFSAVQALRHCPALLSSSSTQAVRHSQELLGIITFSIILCEIQLKFNNKLSAIKLAKLFQIELYFKSGMVVINFNSNLRAMCVSV